MSLRSFVFCDICNPEGYRCIEHRRPSQRDDYYGRRVSDGRAWYEGDDSAAIENGWVISDEGRHICPHCLEHHSPVTDSNSTNQSGKVHTAKTLLFCDLCNPEAVHYIEDRRKGERGNSLGRRIADGRAYYDGDISLAAEEGWQITSRGKHYCPRCGTRHPELTRL